MEVSQDTNRSSRVMRIILYLLLGSGLLLLLVGLVSYVVTGTNLGWTSLSTYAIYIGIPASQLAVLTVTFVRSVRKLSSVVIVVWLENMVNVVLAFRGVFGLY